MRRTIVLLLVVVMAAAPGCALPFRGTTTPVSVSCNVPNARIRVDGTFVQAGTLELKRGDDHVVIADAPGYRPGRATIKSEASYGFLIPEAIFAFISVWFSVPLLVDAISGALYNLNPESVNLILDRDEDVTTQTPAPAGEKPLAPQNGRPAVEPLPSVEQPASTPEPNAPPPSRTAPEPNAPAPARGTCAACGASMGADDARCATCGERRP